MLHLLEIFLVIAAFATLMATGVKSGRQAVALRRHTKQVSREARSKVFSIMAEAGAAQGKAQALPDKLTLLQRKQATAVAALRRLIVLFSALQNARQPLNRILQYIGR